MRIIILTGGIAAGKSLASSRLASLGASIVDADVLSRRVIMRDKPAYHKMKERFGAFFDDAGELERRKLREAVFSDDGLRAELNAMLHPYIYREIEAELSALEARGAETVVVAIPLYFDGEERVQSARTLNIEAPAALRIKRLTERDNISEELAKKMLRSQVSDRVRRENADVTVINDGDTAQFFEKLDKVYAGFKKGGAKE